MPFGKLYVVGTPIGNMSDLSPRAVETLRTVDFIAAEDTRVSLKILNHFEIKNTLISYHEHNRFEQGRVIIDRIKNGESCAIVTDAGMPAISDPGEDLVWHCHEEGIQVVSTPGPVALATALAISGMPSGRFCFEGFLSVNNRSRSEHLESLLDERRTMIFYEAPHKLRKTLRDMYNAFGDRKIAVVRELTKIHEEVKITTLYDAWKFYTDNNAKGEFVLIISGAEEKPKNEATLDDAVIMAKDYMSDGMSASLAAKTAAAETGIKKSEIYSAIAGADRD